MISLRRLNLEESDSVLIRRFAREHDGEAFAVLVGRYADMVYTTCRRVLGDDTQAADAVQETFFQLVKNAGRITGSLGSWLHCVATRRAVDLVRQNASRRRRERTYALDCASGAATWSEVEPAVDEALEQLPEELRELLVLHFLQGRSTIQIAAAQGVSQPTISRRINEALDLLRQTLRGRGIQAGLLPLQTVLLHSNLLAPAALRGSLGKIALAKAAAGTAGWMCAGSAPASGIALKIALAAVIVALGIGTTWLLRHEPDEPSPAASAGTPVIQSADSVVSPDRSAQGNGSTTFETGASPPEPPPPATALAAPRPLPTRPIQLRPAANVAPPSIAAANAAQGSSDPNPAPEELVYPVGAIPPELSPRQDYSVPPVNLFVVNNPRGNARVYPNVASFNTFPNVPNYQVGRTNGALNEVIVLGPAPRFGPPVGQWRYSVPPLAPRAPAGARQPSQVKGF